MKTIYLSELPSFEMIGILEQTIGRDISIVSCEGPAINVYTNDTKIIDDARYWLNVGGIKVLDVA